MWRKACAYLTAIAVLAIGAAAPGFAQDGVEAALPRLVLRQDRAESAPARSASLPSAEDVRQARPRAAALRALAPGRAVLSPIGWVEFCGRAEAEGDCAVSELPERTLRADAATRRLLARVNRNVNAAVAPMSDLDNYGVEERWTYPVDGRGDCEDYALLKRRLLIEAGLPRQALLITVVREANGDGHAVLTVVTDRGDLVLDNKREDIRLWSATGYEFVKRQSAANPNVWVDLRAAAATLARR
jgi:predicted transglutaminase-like cysteine proteinase